MEVVQQLTLASVEINGSWKRMKVAAEGGAIEPKS